MDPISSKYSLEKLFRDFDQSFCEKKILELHQILHDADEVFVFGAGQNGRLIASLLVSMSFKFTAYIDETPSKQNTSINHVPVLPMNSLAGKENCVVISSIFSPTVEFAEVSKRLQPFTAKVMSVFEFLWIAGESSLPFYFLDHPKKIHDYVADVMWLHDHLLDEESKRQLYLHIRFRLTLDYAMAPSWDRILWPWRLDEASIVYIDCGAFDGDTLLPFVKSYSDRLRLAIPIEPDTGNFRRLKNNIDGLPFKIRSKVRALSAATGGKSELRAFNSTLNQASSLSASGSNRVQVLTLDEIVEGSCQKSDRLVIKIDVEGAESETLQGARQTICNRQPFLAVSVYHSPTDLWSLPQAIVNNSSNYRFALRSNGADGADLVAYAFPSS